MKNKFVTLQARLCGLFLFFTIFFIANIFGTIERPMVVVIPSYNNQQWCIRNLASVFSQKYNNYRVIYIDDYSSDNTYELAARCILSCHQEHRTTLIHNSINQGSLANLYRAIHSCDDNEIIVLLDGDDCFAHDEVLNTINDAYEQSGAWIIYSQHQCYPSLQRGDSAAFAPSVIKQCAFRRVNWVSSALRTFYAGLFKNISLHDLLYKGTFFPVAGDLAYMFPLLEMAGDKIYFLDQILYIYNVVNPINDFKIHGGLQKKLDHFIRGKDSYQPIADFHKKVSPSLVDIIIFDTGNGQKTLSSFYMHAHGYGTIHILSHSPCDMYYENTVWHQCNQQNFAATFFEILNHAQSYIIITSDTYALMTAVDLNTCTAMLEQTQAYAFFLSRENSTQVHDKNSFFLRSTSLTIPPHVSLKDTVCAWQFCYGTDMWRSIYNTAMTLYRTRDILHAFAEYHFADIQEFETVCSRAPYDVHAVGLYYSKKH
jgi:glycosyltransferase involved in cell wall biosynthesis